MPAAVAVLGSDALCAAAGHELTRRGIGVLALHGAQLADAPITLDERGFTLDGEVVAALVLREPVRALAPLKFAEEDQGFVLAELSATLLAAANQPAVLAINRLDAESWFEDGEWPVWRRRLRAAGIPASPLSFGERDGAVCWRPYIGGHDRPVPGAEVRRALGSALGHDGVAGRALCAFGEVFDADASAAVRRASRRLSADGVQLTAISYDAAGRVVTVDPLPLIPDDLLDAILAPLTQAIDDHLHHR